MAAADGRNGKGLPFALLGRLRMLFAGEYRSGRLQPHMHLKLEEDLRDMNLFLADNQRLFRERSPARKPKKEGGRCR